VSSRTPVATFCAAAGWELLRQHVKSLPTPFRFLLTMSKPKVVHATTSIATVACSDIGALEHAVTILSNVSNHKMNMDHQGILLSRLRVAGSRTVFRISNLDSLFRAVRVRRRTVIDTDTEGSGKSISRFSRRKAEYSLPKQRKRKGQRLGDRAFDNHRRASEQFFLNLQPLHLPR
jgi:hypothetical protein